MGRARSEETAGRRRPADGVLLRQRLPERRQVAPPEVTRSNGHITVTFSIDEGTPNRVGRITIEGNLKFPRSQLRKLLTMRSGQLFRGSSLQRQVLALSDFYSNRGYAYVNVDPRTQLVHSVSGATSCSWSIPDTR